MITTNITTQPLIDPALELWGARLTGYLSVMGMVILQYDCLLTLKDEVYLLLRALGHQPYISFCCRCDLFGRESSPSQKCCTTLTATCLSLL